MDDWEEIDYKRKQRRKCRREKERDGGTQAREGREERTGEEADQIYLPRSLSDLKPGTQVKVLNVSGSGSGANVGTVR